MKKNTLIITILSILVFVSLSLGIIGVIENEKNATNDSLSSVSYVIRYQYYLDNKLIDKMPVNEENSSKYIYENYDCSNRVVGQWKNDEWKFVVDPSADSTCKLYFVSSEFSIKFKLTNASLSGAKEEEDGLYTVGTKVSSGKDYVAELTPKEGYSYKNASCTNNEEISWDKDNNEITIKNINADTQCDVLFEESIYEIKAVVENGSGGSQLSVKHNGEAKLTITPSIGYGNPKITCTNKQEGIWQDNTFTIDKVTNSSSCIVSFDILSFDILVNVTNGESDITGIQKIDYNKTITYILTPAEDYSAFNPNITGCDSYTSVVADTYDKLIFTIKNVTKSDTCNVEFNKFD